MRQLDLPKLVHETAQEFGLRGAAAYQALFQSAEVTAKYTGPFLVAPTISMGEAFGAKVAADPDATGLLLYRGGRALEILLRRLVPDNVAKNLHPLVTSRVMAESAIRDLEQTTATTIGTPDTRYNHKQIDDSLIDGSYEPFIRYLWRQGAFDGHVDMFDICHHGTLSNLLAHVGVKATTHLVFFQASARDPNSRNKRGHLVNHSRPDRLFGDPKWLPLLNREETMRAVEDTLNGPYSTAERIVDGEPEYWPEAKLHHSIDPASLEPAWRDEEVRIAAKALNLLVLDELGEAVAEERRSRPRSLGEGWIPYEIAVGRQRFLGQMHALLTGDLRLDQAFGAVMRTVVRPTKPEKAYRPPIRGQPYPRALRIFGAQLKASHRAFSAQRRKIA